MEDLFSRSIHSVSWMTGQKVARVSFSTVVYVFLARLLAPEHFGLMAMALVVTHLANRFNDHGFASAIIQEKNLTEEHLSSAFYVTNAIGLLVFGLVFLAAPAVADWFEQPRLDVLLKVLALQFPLVSLYTVPKAILKKNLDYRALTLCTFSSEVLSGTFAVLLAWNGFGVWSLVFKILTYQFLNSIVVWSASGWFPSVVFGYRKVKKLYEFGFNVLGERVVNYLNRKADDIIVGYGLGSVALGYYDVAYRLILKVTNLVSRPMTNVSYSTFSHLQDDIPRLRRTFLICVEFMALIAFPSFLILAVSAPELVPLVLGGQWHPAVPVVQVLCFVGLLQSVDLFNPKIYKATNHPTWSLLVTLLQGVCNVVVFVIAVQWGIVAVALSFFLVYLVLFPFRCYLVHRLIQYDLRSFLVAFVEPLLASLLMMVLYRLFSRVFVLEEMVPFGLSVLASLGIYGASIYLFFGNRLFRIVRTIRGQMGS